MNISKNSLKIQGPSFSGHKRVLDKCGFEKHNFFYFFDSSKYTCDVQFFNIEKDIKGNFSVDNKKPVFELPLESGVPVSEDMSEHIEIDDETGFAYRFKLTEKLSAEDIKNGKKPEISYAFDNGTVIGILNSDPNNKYNVILNNRALIEQNGPMQLIMPDGYNPAFDDPAARAEVLPSVRTHANKLGGKFKGIIARLADIRKEGIKRIVGTPFTKDNISSHKYWTENAYQVSPDFGTEEDFKEFQVELFKNGMNWIADAALVNEGFGGIHLSEVLRKGDGAFSKNMFRADERISLGIIPDNASTNIDKKDGKPTTRIKLINSPFLVGSDGSYTKQNDAYDPKKPTYVQFYASNLASQEQIDSDSPIDMTTYAKKNTDNIYDITRHDDAVYPFPIEVSPSELARNAKRVVSSNGTIDLANIDTIKALLDFTNFNVVNKSDAGGLEVWDGNVDIAKLNFYRSEKDDARFTKLPPAEREAAIENFERGALAVRDYAVNSGKYWTQLAADTQFEYASSLFAGISEQTPESYMQKIKDLVNEGKLPKTTLDVVDLEVVENVLNGDYNQRRLYNADMRSEFNPQPYGNDYSVNDYILKKAMDLPLETLPVATNLLGILTSPYLTKRANVAEELGVSRFDLTSANNPNLPAEYRATYEKMDSLYKEIASRIESILSEISGVKDDKDNVTEYGKYVISEIAPDLTKYLILKSLNPDADVRISRNGHFDFSNVNEQDITMQLFGIGYDNKTAKEEAQIIVSALENGLKSIDTSLLSPLKSTVERRFSTRTLDDYKIAEMIIDRTESGLGWRIDAAKDIAAIDSVRSNVDSMTTAWNNVIDFWKLFNQSVISINPHAYTTAEITDLSDLMKAGTSPIFNDDADAERKFLEETGITSVANYNFFFSLLPDLFGQLLLEDIDDSNGWQAREEMNKRILEKMDKGWGGNPGFLFQSPDDGVTNSYTFVGNHDKPRMTHLLSLDQYLFKSDFSSPEHKNAALDVLLLSYGDEKSLINDLSPLFDKAFSDVIKDENLKTSLKNAFAQVSHELLNSSGDEFTTKKLGSERLTSSVKTVFEKVQDKLSASDKKAFEELYNSDFESSFVSSIQRAILTNANSMAVTMGSRLNTAFASVVENEEDLKAIQKALSDLSSGTYLGKKFHTEAFGTRPIDVAIKSVLAQAEYNGHKIENKEDITANVFKSVVEPSFDRFASIYKLLVLLPGSPTDFAGDRVGATGYESKAKNYHQQNRNVINWEWLENDPNNKYSFVRDFYNQMNEIANIRSHKKLSALNDGSTITLPIYNKGKNENNPHLQAVLRYNDKDSVVLSVHNSVGASGSFTERMDRKGTNSLVSSADDRFVLYKNASNPKSGLKHGLTAGMKFYNARFIGTAKEANEEYTVCYDKDTDEYFLQKKVKIAGVWTPVDITIEPEDLNALVLYKT